MVDVDSMGTSRFLHALGKEIRQTSLETFTCSTHAGWTLRPLGDIRSITKPLHLLAMECPLDMVCHR